MGTIRQGVTLVGRKSRVDTGALFDTGCTHSLIEESLAKRLGPLDDLPEPMEFEAAIGHFKCRKGIFVDVHIGEHRYPSQFRVVHGLTETVVLGVDFMQVWNVKLDPRKHIAILDPKALRMKAVSGRCERPR